MKIIQKITSLLLLFAFLVSLTFLTFKIALQSDTFSKFAVLAQHQGMWFFLRYVVMDWLIWIGLPVSTVVMGALLWNKTRGLMIAGLTMIVGGILCWILALCWIGGARKPLEVILTHSFVVSHARVGSVLLFFGSLFLLGDAKQRGSRPTNIFT